MITYNMNCAHCKEIWSDSFEYNFCPNCYSDKVVTFISVKEFDRNLAPVINIFSRQRVA